MVACRGIEMLGFRELVTGEDRKACILKKVWPTMAGTAH